MQRIRVNADATALTGLVGGERHAQYLHGVKRVPPEWALTVA
jgi:hypothetical protein